MNIAIVGCGPAGLAAALMLYRDGHHVVMFERFETPRPVGSGIILQPTGLAVLRELGLSSDIHSCGRRIDNLHGLSIPSGKTVLDVNYSALGVGFHGLAVHRAALFDVLYAAVQACEVEIRTGVEVTPAEHAMQIQSGSFDFLIDASGATSSVQSPGSASSSRRMLTYGALWGSFSWPDSGFATNALEQRYVGAHRMIGVMPIGQHTGVTSDQVAFFWSIRTDQYEAWLSDGLDAWKQDVRLIWPETDSILEQITDPSQMALARYGHGTMHRPYREKVVFLGDSAHSTSPQLGQGANMALLDAWAFASALRNSLDVESAMRNYAKSRRWHVRAFQLSSLALTPFYQSDSRVLSALRDLLFDPISKLPVARRVVAGLISGMLAGPPRDLDYGNSVRDLG